MSTRPDPRETSGDPGDRYDPTRQAPEDDPTDGLGGAEPGPDGIRSAGTTQVMPGVDDATGSPGVAIESESAQD